MNYLVILSNHFNMSNIVSIERKHAPTKTVHVNQTGVLSYKTAPIKSN